MFGTIIKGASAYNEIALETGVNAVSPHKLVVMLFDGALVALTTAGAHMRGQNISGKGQAISKAIQIIESGLRASLDKNAGGEIAANLDALYAYMVNRLLVANLNNQPEILDEVHGLLKDLKESWEAIGDTPKNVQPTEFAAPSARDPLMPQESRLVKA